MKAFSHTNAKTLAEASAALAGGQAEIIAGGTDLIGRLKDNILPDLSHRLDQHQDHSRSGLHQGRRRGC